MMRKPGYYTKEGLEKLKKELYTLETKTRPAIIHQIAEARAKGDLSENAEYHAAKDEQGLVEMRIAELKSEISNARIITASSVDTSHVSILTRVTLKDKKTGKQLIYKLVAEKEADVEKGKISITSPIGRALLGKKPGDMVQVTVPAGELTFEIVRIQS